MNIRVMLSDINLAAHPTLNEGNGWWERPSNLPHQMKGESILRELSISLSQGIKELLIKVDEGEQSVCFTNDTRTINAGKKQPAQRLK